MPSHCKVRKWWSITIDQDEWFNLYLYLGSCWVKSRYEARYDTRYETGYESGPEPKEVSINWSNREYHGAERSLDTKSRAEIQSLRTGITSNQFQDHLLKKDKFVDDLFIIYQINQEPGSVVVRERPGFFSQCFMSENR